jgi:hypothetical protein
MNDLAVLLSGIGVCFIAFVIVLTAAVAVIVVTGDKHDH